MKSGRRKWLEEARTLLFMLCILRVWVLFWRSEFVHKMAPGTILWPQTRGSLDGNPNWPNQKLLGGPIIGVPSATQVKLIGPSRETHVGPGTQTKAARALLCFLHTAWWRDLSEAPAIDFQLLLALQAAPMWECRALAWHPTTPGDVEREGAVDTWQAISREDRKGTGPECILLMVLNQLSWAMNHSVDKRFMPLACSSALSNIKGLTDHEYDPSCLSEQTQCPFMWSKSFVTFCLVEHFTVFKGRQSGWSCWQKLLRVAFGHLSIYSHVAYGLSITLTEPIGLWELLKGPKRGKPGSDSSDYTPPSHRSYQHPL